VCLVFGEKQREHDFLYREVLQQWQAEGRLSTLLTAFSRDTAEKFYVQHALAANSPRVTDLLQRGAHLYVCGNKRHLDGAVQEAIDPMLPPAAGWTALQAQGRVHCELY
jgi:sulfite reductase (NADPH) flavoprotein alpha-component